jgi:hypothetical protein
MGVILVTPNHTTLKLRMSSQTFGKVTGYQDKWHPTVEWTEIHLPDTLRVAMFNRNMYCLILPKIPWDKVTTSLPGFPKGAHFCALGRLEPSLTPRELDQIDDHLTEPMKGSITYATIASNRGRSLALMLAQNCKAGIYNYRSLVAGTKLKLRSANRLKKNWMAYVHLLQTE